MKRKPRKLALVRETLVSLQDRPLRPVAGGTGFTPGCDTYQDCSIACFIPTDIAHGCQ